MIAVRPRDADFWRQLADEAAAEAREEPAITAADEVSSCAIIWRHLAELLAPAESLKGQYQKIARATGLTARRQRDIRAGTLHAIPSHQARALRKAYADAIKIAEARLGDMKRESVAFAHLDSLGRDSISAASDFNRDGKTKP